MRSETKFDMSKLNTFIKSISDKQAVQVGIMGKKNARKDGKKGAGSNAEIGMLHEYGSIQRRIPARSFLRMPIAMKGAQIVKEAAADAKKLMAQGNITLLLKRLGIACENAIRAAFVSRGFGTWKENAPLTIRRKGSDRPLIDTAQLSRSISSRVVKVK